MNLIMINHPSTSFNQLSIFQSIFTSSLNIFQQSFQQVFFLQNFFWFISLHLSKSFLFNTFSFKKSSLIKKLELFIFSFSSPFAKRTEGLTAWIILCLSSPLQKIQRTNRLRILCPNTLEGTSFVVQVEGTSTWGLLYWEQEMVHLLWISSSGGYIHLVIQREQGRVHPLWIFGL